MKKIFTTALVMLGISFLSIQFIPVERTNPKVIHQPNWDSPQTKALFYRACADCHSYETQWPLYSKIAPLSWFIADHVTEGREKFNISIPDMGDADEAAKEVYKNKMPLPSYLWLHPNARLTHQEKEQFILGLKTTFGEPAPYEEHSE